MKFIICNNAENLRKALDSDSRWTATVEAEYGDDCVEGSLVTLAHHGPRKGQRCPCLYDNFDLGDDLRIEVVGLSHLDLDTVGGCMALMGLKFAWPSFWRAAACADEEGIHVAKERVGPGNWGMEEIYFLYHVKRIIAALSRSCRATEEPTDITSSMNLLVASLNDTFLHEKDNALENGRDLEEAEVTKANRSFVSMDEEGIIIRVAPYFSNSFYQHPLGDSGDVVIAFNTSYQSITVSTREPIPGFSCRKFVQSLWGPKAGGHDGIAGSPRDRVMTFSDLSVAYTVLNMRLQGRRTGIDA